MAEAPPLMRKMHSVSVGGASPSACSMESAAEAPAKEASFGTGCPPRKNWIVVGRCSGAIACDECALQVA